MKRFFKAIALLLVVILMSGCVKYNIDMKVTNDGKMNMTFIYGVSSDLGGEESTNEDNEAIEKLKEQGWKFEEYKDDKFTGVKMYKDFDDINAISVDADTLVDLNEFGQEGKLPEHLFQKKEENGKTIYVAKFAFSLSDSDDEPADEETDADTEAMMKQMMSSMDLKFYFEAPTIVSSNATTTEGNKLTWDLTKLEEGKNIEFTFSLGDKKATSTSLPTSLPIVPIAIGGVVVLVIILILVLSKKKKPVDVAVSEPIQPTPVAPVEPVAPVVPEVPVTPEAPVAPVEPVQVITPVEPVAPVVPEVPTDQNNNLM